MAIAPISPVLWQAMDCVDARQIVLVSGRSWWRSANSSSFTISSKRPRPLSRPDGSTTGNRRVVPPARARQLGLRDEVIVDAISDRSAARNL